MLIFQISRGALLGGGSLALANSIALSYSGDHKLVTYIVWYALAVVLLISGVGPWVKIHRWQHGRSASREGQSAPPPAARNEAVQELEGRATDSSEAKIVVFPAHQIPLGREIGALFELAHWPVNLIETPQEPFHQKYVEGVEIAGANSVLVDTVASALDTAGIPSISKVIRKSKIPKDNPKHQRAIESIRVTVGHTP